jgi:alginate O-acetyltransferase complex protein AlgJ
MSRTSQWTIAGLVATVALTAAAADMPVSELELKFRAACTAMNQSHLEGTTEIIIGRGPWFVLGTELDYVTFGRFWGPDAARGNPDKPPAAADPLAAIVDFSRQLKERGIDLILMPAPTRVVIFPEAVMGEGALPPGTPPRLHSTEPEFYKVLRSKGVTVVDLTPAFLVERRGEHGTVFVPGDSHWTGYGLSIAGREAAKALKKRPWVAAVPKHQYTSKWTKTTYAGHILERVREVTGDKIHQADEIWLRVISETTPQGPRDVSPFQPDSPVVVIGDSYTNWWHAQSAGLPQQIGYELGFPVDLMNSEAGGATNARLNLIRRARSEPAYLTKLKAVVWVFASRGFIHTGDGWSLLPITAQAPAKAGGGS